MGCHATRLSFAIVIIAGIGASILGGCADDDPCPEGDCPCADAFVIAEQCCHGFQSPVDGQCVTRAWPPPREPMLGEPGADDVEVAMDGAGQPLVSWVHGASIEQIRPMLAERDAQGWRVQSPGDPINGLGTRLTMAAASDSRVALATWTQYRTEFDEDGTPRDRAAVYMATRSESGAWTYPPPGETLSFGDKAFDPRPMISATGEALVTWNQWRLAEGGGYGVAVARRGPQDNTFTVPTSDADLLSPDVLFSNKPQIATGSNGDAAIVWYQSEGGGLRMFASERDGIDGAFTRPAASAYLSPEGPPLASHGVRNPVVAMGPFGEALAVWSQEHPSGAVALYVAERNGFGTWTPPSDIDDTFAPLGTFATCSDVVIGPRSEALVVWFDGPQGATVVYGAHRDETQTWDSPPPFGEPLSTPGATAEAPRLAMGPAGEAVVVWSERRDGQWRVMTRRRNPRSTLWGDAVEVSDPALGDALEPAVAIGGRGDVAIAWKQGPPTAERVGVAILPS